MKENMHDLIHTVVNFNPPPPPFLFGGWLLFCSVFPLPPFPASLKNVYRDQLQ